MEDIFSTSFDSDYHFLGFSKSELDILIWKSQEMIVTIKTSGKNIFHNVARLMRKSELTENRVQGLDLDLLMQIQSTDVMTNIKKDVIGTNLVRNGYLRAREALHYHCPPHWTADKLLRVGLGLSHLLSFIMPNLESGRIVVHILQMTEAEVIKEDVVTIKNKAQ